MFDFRHFLRADAAATPVSFLMPPLMPLIAFRLLMLAGLRPRRMPFACLRHFIYLPLLLSRFSLLRYAAMRY